jgi:SAM-dependent methyltransferase
MQFGDGEFDVVSSCFGVIFAPDPPAAAHELARVCRPHGRLGLTTWLPSAGLHALYDAFYDEPPNRNADAWGDEASVRDMLGGSFELDVTPRTWVLENDSLEAHWDWSATAVPPLAALLRDLDPVRREELHARFLEVSAPHVQPDGRVHEERPYLLVTGRRR